MEKLIEIKKVANNDIKNDLTDYLNYSQLNKEKILSELNSNILGLSEVNAQKRLIENGKNVAIKDDKKSPLYFLFNSFKDHFIIILLFLAVINYSLGDSIGSFVIILIAMISALIRFFQDYSVYQFNEKLKSRIYSTCIVLRDGVEKEIKVENVVVGDIVKLNAGAIIPADVLVLESKDLYINQSSFTGESIPVEKTIKANKAKEIFDINNVILMNASVISGSAT